MQRDKRFILIRHGELPKRCAGRFVGRTDAPLSRAGRASCARLAPVWRRICSGEGERKIIVSPLLRARSSVHAVCGKEKFLTDERLSEIDFGKWEMLNFSEIRKKYPWDLVQWKKDPASFAFPGGEETGDFHERTHGFLAEILKSEDPCITLVTHGGVIVELLRELLDLPGNDYWRWQPDRGSLSVVDLWKADSGKWITKLHLFNLTIPEDLHG